MNLLLEHYVNPVSLYSVYLVAVILVALRWGTGPSVFASVLSLLTFDFLFVHPKFTLVMARPGDVVSALVFLLASIVIGQLIRITRRQYEQLFAHLLQYRDALGAGKACAWRPDQQ